MQATPEEPKPVGLVLDFQMSGEPGDMLAFAVAASLSTLDKPEADLLTFSLTGSGLEGAAFTDAIARFYTMRALRDYPERFRRYRSPLPVGLAEDKPTASSPALAKPLAKKNPDGEPVYEHAVEVFTDTADPAAVIRNGLTAQEDDSTAVVLTGSAINLSRVLGLNLGPDLIKSKVKRLVMALTPDEVAAEPAALKRVLADWSSPLYFIEPTEDLTVPSAAILNEITWAEDHPMVDALRSHPDLPAEIEARSAAAVLAAVRPEAAGFGEPEAGRLAFGDDGKLSFTPEADGPHHRLRIADAAGLRQTLTELAVREPAARELPDFLKRLIEDQKKKEEEQQQEQKTDEPSAEQR